MHIFNDWVNIIYNIIFDVARHTEFGFYFLSEMFYSSGWIYRCVDDIFCTLCYFVYFLFVRLHKYGKMSNLLFCNNKRFAFFALYKSDFVERIERGEKFNTFYHMMNLENFQHFKKRIATKKIENIDLKRN